MSIDLIVLIRVLLQHDRVQLLCARRFLILSFTPRLAEFINDEVPIAIRAKHRTLDRQRTDLYVCLSLGGRYH